MGEKGGCVCTSVCAGVWVSKIMTKNSTAPTKNQVWTCVNVHRQQNVNDADDLHPSAISWRKTKEALCRGSSELHSSQKE